MKHEPPVIPFLFFVAVIITLSSIAVYAGLKCNFIRPTAPVVMNQPSTQEPAAETGDADVMAELKKDPEAVAKFDELMDNFHLVKFVKIPNGYIFEIGPQGNFITTDTSLWIAEESKSIQKIISGFSGECSSFAWSVDEDKIIIDQMTSPCEAFANYTHKELDFYGTELTSLVYSSTGDVINYSNENLTIEIAPDFKDALCEEKKYDFTEKQLPEILFYGIIINETPFNLAKPTNVACGVAYGESLTNPGLDSPILKDGVLSFSLPNGQTATINTNKLIPNKTEIKKLDKTAVTFK